MMTRVFEGIPRFSSRPCLSKQSPATRQLARGDEFLRSHSFGEDVGLLKKSVDLNKFNSRSGTNVRLEKEVLNGNVFSTRSHLDSAGSGNSPIVVLKNSRLDRDRRGALELHFVRDFSKQATSRNEFSHSLTESNELGFCGRKSNFGL